MMQHCLFVVLHDLPVSVTEGDALEGGGYGQMPSLITGKVVSPAIGDAGKERL